MKIIVDDFRIEFSNFHCVDLLKKKQKLFKEKSNQVQEHNALFYQKSGHIHDKHTLNCNYATTIHSKESNTRYRM